MLCKRHGTPRRVDVCSLGCFSLHLTPHGRDEDEASVRATETGGVIAGAVGRDGKRSKVFLATYESSFN